MTLVQSVLSEVLNGHWKPGQHLVGQELADRHGVSQTPIRDACRNTLLAREIGRLKLLFRAYRDTAWDRVATMNDFSHIPVEAVEHLAILEALAARDASAAARAMASHIRSTERHWCRNMA